MAGAILLTLATACGDGNPGQGSDSALRLSSSSEECRLSVEPVLDTLQLAIRAAGRDTRSWLISIDAKMPDAVAPCTSAVARPTRQAIAKLSEAHDAVVGARDAGSTRAQARNGSRETFDMAQENLEEARQALERPH